jgi:NADPH:quinone reductase-like Zn-dependent oxidoreductase
LRAVRFDRFGGPEVLHVAELDDPEAGDGQVVLRLRGCALNHIDVDVRNGTSRLPIVPPFTPGGEGAGEIESLGPGVSGWEVGERVMPYLLETCHRCRFCLTGRDQLCESKAVTSLDPRFGYSERFVCRADQLLRVPDTVADVPAAALQGAFSTAWHMLFSRGGLTTGESVLISSVGSGIGSAALQLAKLAGAYVIGTASSEAKLRAAERYGMDVGIHHEREDLTARVLEVTRGRGVDLAFEHVGGATFTRALEALSADGRLVTCGAHTGEVVDLDIVRLFRTERRVIGCFAYSRAEAERIVQLAGRGLIEPVVYRTFPLEEARVAMETMERREHFGKIVLTP